MFKKFLDRGGLWVMAQGLLLALVAASPFWMPTVLPWTGPAHHIAGGCLITLGSGLLLAGVLKLGSSLTALPHPRDDASLRTDGIYRHVRHPIYGGLIVLVAGYCLVMPSPLELLFALATLFFFDQKARVEERWLARRYPSYPEYAGRTRKFFPGIY